MKTEIQKHKSYQKATTLYASAEKNLDKVGECLAEAAAQFTDDEVVESFCADQNLEPQIVLDLLHVAQGKLDKRLRWDFSTVAKRLRKFPIKIQSQAFEDGFEVATSATKRTIKTYTRLSVKEAKRLLDVKSVFPRICSVAEQQNDFAPKQEEKPYTFVGTKLKLRRPVSRAEIRDIIAEFDAYLETGNIVAL